ncbi:MAG: hypothetical protein ACHQ0I_04740 [Candidatus Lutacidiplasmatales archaeon]
MSNAWALTVGAAGVPSGELTDTPGEGDDATVSATEALSVTLSSKEYVLPAVKRLDPTRQVSDAPPKAPLPASTAHSVAVA